MLNNQDTVINREDMLEPEFKLRKDYVFKCKSFSIYRLKAQYFLDEGRNSYGDRELQGGYVIKLLEKIAGMNRDETLEFIIDQYNQNKLKFVK